MKIGVICRALLFTVLGASASAAELTVRVGAFVIPGSPSAVIFDDFEQAVEAADDNIDVQLLVSGEAGSEDVVLSAIRRGRIHIGSISTLALSSIVPEISLIESPYLFDDVDQGHYVLRNFLIPHFKTVFAGYGLELMHWLDIGYFGMYGKTPIAIPQDAIGRRLRASASPISTLFLRALRADVIPVPSPDVVPGLQTGLLDGGEALLIAYYGTGIDKEAPNFTLTNHSYIATLLIANQRWFNGLPQNTRATLRNRFPDENRTGELARGMYTDTLLQAEQAGLNIIRPSEAQQTLWRQQVASVRPEFAADLGEEGRALLELIQRGKTAYAAQQDISE